MSEPFSEWECMPGIAPGLIESMDAAGCESGVHVPDGEARDSSDESRQFTSLPNAA
jgi:hypothetical protein